MNFYLSKQVIDHYENPRNVGSFDKGDKDVGTGLVGAPACGDVMKLQVLNIVALSFYAFPIKTLFSKLNTLQFK